MVERLLELKNNRKCQVRLSTRFSSRWGRSQQKKSLKSLMETYDEDGDDDDEFQFEYAKPTTLKSSRISYINNSGSITETKLPSIWTKFKTWLKGF